MLSRDSILWYERIENNDDDNGILSIRNNLTRESLTGSDIDILTAHIFYFSIFAFFYKYFRFLLSLCVDRLNILNDFSVS